MEIIARQIKKLRKAYGYSQNRFGQAVGISQRKVTDLENHKQKVSAELLIRIAKVFSIDIDYFYNPEAQPHSADILFRAKEKMKDDDYKVLAALQRICYDLDVLEQTVKGKSTKKIYRKYDIGLNRSMFEEAEEVALKEREYFELRMDPVVDIRSTLLREDVDLLEAALEYRISGFFFTLQNGRPFLVVNSTLQPYSKNFSIAHEYAHLLLDCKESFNIICKDLEKPQGENVEKRANAFAAEFLLPSEVVEKSEPTRYNVVMLMNDFKVSREVILNRWQRLGIITASLKAELSGSKFQPSKVMMELGMENEFTAFLEKRPKRGTKKTPRKASFSVHSLLPKKYIELAISAFKANRITYDKLSDYLYISPTELETRLGIAPPRSTKYDSLVSKA